MTNRFFSIWF